ncbi:hypothetical protein RS030_111805 [Cryptosporidium xiaoi]|uniref:Uncharacterized protein n=1 Tax=Cryptosporidium xiaoi TaxID=659607 RepID=A0AAV9Y3C6_9CRYT
MSCKPSKVKFQIATYLAFFFGLVSGADNLGCKHATLKNSVFDFCAKTEYEEQKLLLELQTIPTVSLDITLSSDLSSKDGIFEGSEQEIIRKSPGELKIRSKDYEELKEDDKEEEEDIKEIVVTEGGIVGTEGEIVGTGGIEGEKYDRYDDKDQGEYINEYYETNSGKKCLYIEEVEIMDIFIGIYHLRKDIDAMNEEIEKESYEILSSLDNTVNEDTSNAVNEDTSNAVNEDTSNTVNEDTSSTVNKDTSSTVNKDTSSTVNKDTSSTVNEDTSNTVNKDNSNILHDTMNPEQVEKPNYVSRYLRLLKKLKCQNKQFRQRTEPVGTHKDDVLTDLQMSPPIIGSQMPDSLPIIKRRVVPEIPLDIESASYKYEVMKNQYKLKREKERLRDILDSQLKSISKLMEKHSELLSLLDELEKKKKYIDVINDLKIKLQLQKSKIESLETERLELLRELLHQRINILEIRNRIASLQKKLLGNGELLYRSCIEVQINYPIIEDAENSKKQQRRYRSELKMRISGKQKPAKRFISCLFIKPNISDLDLSKVTVLHKGDKVGTLYPELPEVVVDLGKISPKKPAEIYTSRLSIYRSKGEWHPRKDFGEEQESGLNVVGGLDVPESVKESDPKSKKGPVRIDAEEILEVLKKFNKKRREETYISEQVKYNNIYDNWLLQKKTADRRKEKEERKNICKRETLKKFAKECQKAKFQADREERLRKRKEETKIEADEAAGRLSALTKGCG